MSHTREDLMTQLNELRLKISNLCDEKAIERMQMAQPLQGPAFSILVELQGVKVKANKTDDELQKEILAVKAFFDETLEALRKLIAGRKDQAQIQKHIDAAQQAGDKVFQETKDKSQAVSASSSSSTLFQQPQPVAEQKMKEIEDIFQTISDKMQVYIDKLSEFLRTAEKEKRKLLGQNFKRMLEEKKLLIVKGEALKNRVEAVEHVHAIFNEAIQNILGEKKIKEGPEEVKEALKKNVIKKIFNPKKVSIKEDVLGAYVNDAAFHAELRKISPIKDLEEMDNKLQKYINALDRVKSQEAANALKKQLTIIRNTIHDANTLQEKLRAADQIKEAFNQARFNKYIKNIVDDFYKDQSIDANIENFKGAVASREKLNIPDNIQAPSVYLKST